MLKFYLHNASTTVAGTLPGASTLSATTPNSTSAGASTNRVMDGTIGTSQTSATIASLASASAQRWWYRRFISPPLAAQLILGNVNWSLHNGCQESNTNMNGGTAHGTLVLWRPSTGASVATVFDRNSTGDASCWGLAANTNQQAGNGNNVQTPDVTAADGDVLVYELWGGTFVNQNMAVSYTGTMYYDGTTEDSTTTNAAYLLAANDIKLYQPYSHPTNFQDPGFMMKIYRNWCKMRHGIFVPSYC